ncbi:energy transducer TonB [Paraburkholderia sediminicola]|uniref:energy transducer TonB n=1 Tax=Paraburkholderia sediminicola TaxID=458836 RepID=UPI0038BB77B4
MDESQKVRITLALLVALMVWIVFLSAFGHWLGATTARPPAKPLEMRMVELDPPPAPVVHTAPAPAPATKPADKRARALPQRAVPPARSQPEMQSMHSVAPAPPAQTTEEAKPAAEPPAHAAAPSEEKSAATASGDAAAHSISQPLPELPDDLREQAYQTVATARFMIHVDGSVDVELIKPTPNPRLNQILLESLRKWRFFPAMQAGHPVESRQDIRVHFNVN